MTKRTPPEIQQKIIANNKTGRYTHLQIGQKYGISRQCVWAIVDRYKKRSSQLPTTTRKPSKSDMITLLNRIDWEKTELGDIWDIMRQGLRKKFTPIR